MCECETVFVLAMMYLALLHGRQKDVELQCMAMSMIEGNRNRLRSRCEK